jgi:hypothetical protein
MNIEAEVVYKITVNVDTDDMGVFDDFDSFELTEKMNDKIKDQAEHILQTSTIKPIIKIIKIRKD